ncbi:hypothetical protein BS78_05G093000 [Paspalum vaginatum]|nr:hypothetical protein BS78_05G093000 [Paspalum vaginatum]
MKPWALKRASINNLAPSRSSVVGTRKVFTFFDLLSYFWPLCSSDALRSELERRKEPTSVKKIDAVVKDLVYNPKDISVQLYVREAKQALQGVKTEEESDEQPHPKIPNPETETEFAGFMRKEDLWFTYSRHQPLLLADRLVPYRHRLSALRNFLQHPPQERVYAALDTILSSMFHLLYTKQKTYMTTLGVLTIYLTVPLSIAAIGLFAKAPKHGYSQSDVMVTYILLSWIAATEVLQLYCLLYVRTCQMYCAFKSVNVVRVPQHSIMSFVVRRKTATRSMNKMLLAALIGLDDSVNRSSWYNGPTSTCRRIVHAVLQQVELGWKEYIHDASSFRRFNDRRGCWTVSRCQQQHVVDQPSSSRLAVIRSSLRVPFDRSVVLWHIATDLCSHHHDGAPSPSNEPKEDPAATARAISNYMAYLLILHPEMLMAGTTPDLFDIACEDLEVILKHDKEPPAPLHEKGLAQGIVRNAGSLLSWLFERNLISPVLWEASKLAEALMEMGSEERWPLIEGVWTEMLCYSASRCRGYLHAKSLGQGRELLTYVWLFLSQMGMDTYADRLQTPEAPEEEDEDVGVGDASTSQPQEAPPQLEEITLA